MMTVSAVPVPVQAPAPQHWLKILRLSFKVCTGIYHNARVELYHLNIKTLKFNWRSCPKDTVFRFLLLEKFKAHFIIV
jgi:hypothetical protein